MVGRPVLLADIGGSRARFGLLDEDDRVDRVAVLDCAAHPSLIDACRAYLAEHAAGVTPVAAGFAVAAAVAGDRVKLTNRAWSFSIEELRGELGVERVEVLNDFQALALALPLLADEDLRPLKPGDAVPGAPVGLLGPGTGLGVAGLVLDGARAVPIASEGGHRDLAATDEREWRICRHLRQRFERVSVERVLSGPGLVNLHGAICALDGRAEDALESAAEVVDEARRGERCCLEAVELFSAWLGAVAGDLALTLGARGGIYVGGGVVPRMGDLFDLESFRERFVAKGRFRRYLEPVPVTLIVKKATALPGVAAWMRRPALKR